MPSSSNRAWSKSFPREPFAMSSCIFNTGTPWTTTDFHGRSRYAIGRLCFKWALSVSIYWWMTFTCSCNNRAAGYGAWVWTTRLPPFVQWTPLIPGGTMGFWSSHADWDWLRITVAMVSTMVWAGSCASSGGGVIQENIRQYGEWDNGGRVLVCITGMAFMHLGRVMGMVGVVVSGVTDDMAAAVVSAYVGLCLGPGVAFGVGSKCKIRILSLSCSDWGGGGMVL